MSHTEDGPNPLAKVTDEELIRELKFRKRLRVMENSGGYYSELAEDGEYMRWLDRDLMSGLTRILENELCIVVEDRVLRRDEHNRPVRSARHASVTVLIPDDVDPADPQDRWEGWPNPPKE